MRARCGVWPRETTKIVVHLARIWASGHRTARMYRRTVLRLTAAIAFALVLHSVSVAVAAPIRAPLSVTVDVAGLDDAPGVDARAVEQVLTARLVQDGFEVVAPSSSPQLTVSVRSRRGDAGIVVSVVATGFSRERDVALGSATTAQLSLEIAHKAVALARLAAESVLAPVPEPPDATPSPGTSRARTSEVVPPPALAKDEGPSSDRRETGIGAGAHARAGGVDLRMVVIARVPLARSLGAVGLVGATVARAGSVDIHEIDGSLGVGPTWPVAASVHVELAVLAGVRVHRFAIDRAVVEPRGTRVDLQLTVPGRVRLDLGDSLALWGMVALTLSAAREHVVGPEVLWRRGVAGGSAQLGLSATF